VAPHGVVAIAKIVLGLRIVWRDAHCFLVGGERFFPSTHIEKGITKAFESLDGSRMLASHAPVGVDRFRPLIGFGKSVGFFSPSRSTYFSLLRGLTTLRVTRCGLPDRDQSHKKCDRQHEKKSLFQPGEVDVHRFHKYKTGRGGIAAPESDVLTRID